MLDPSFQVLLTNGGLDSNILKILSELLTNGGLDSDILKVLLSALLTKFIYDLSFAQRRIVDYD